MMRVTILGSGTSTGVPEYRCECETCQDARRPGSKNRRTRASIHVEVAGVHLQFDTGPNFLDQIDQNRIHQIDAVIYTHCHADHISGTNDLVMPCRKQQCAMPVYGSEETLAVLQRNYDYMFNHDTYQGGGIGHLVPHPIGPHFEVAGVPLQALLVEHGAVTTHGYRLGAFAYLPDVKRIPPATLDSLQGVEVLIIDGLSFNPRHPTHLSVGEAIEIATMLGVREAYLTHLMHRLDHRYFPEQCAEHGVELPANVHLAFDGQVLQI